MSEINLPLKDLKIKSLTQANLYFPLFLLTDKTRLNYIKSAFAKSNASREKLSLLKANNSTPNRAFFVRAIYLSNKNSLISDKLFPMVERNGQPFVVGCIP